MDAKIKEIINRQTKYGVMFAELPGILESARIRETMLSLDKKSGEYQSLLSKVRMLDGWIESVGRDGRIHETIKVDGSASGRMSHSKPNLAGVPREDRYRKLFISPKGYKIVGVDASSLELRMLAHYMDDRDYIEEIINGDIHHAIQMATGLQSRNKAKSFIFALIYGAGDEKIGKILGRTAEDARGVKTNFYDNTPAFKDLRNNVIRASSKGWIRGIDGLGKQVDQSYKAMNILLQSAGATIMKKALVLLDESASAKGYDFKFVLNVHDEIQTEVREDQAEDFGKLAVDSIIKAGEFYDLKCPLDAKYLIGDNWAQTH